MSEDGKAAPIAKLESAVNTENASRNERILFIHTDHRGAPVAMTDRSRKIVWRAAVSPWGQTKVGSGDATLNLRLPGQYFDAETGLHDNFHRTYDPGSGRYLQPDPLGYPDGPDAYLYASGDPINKTDPLGWYQIDVHYYVTYFLAVMAGVSAQDALTMALATQYVDDNPNTWPVDPNNYKDNVLHPVDANRRLVRYHFTQSPDRDPQPTSTEISVDPNTLLVTVSDDYKKRRVLDDPQNDQLRALLGAANYNPRTTQNPLGVRPCTRIQLFGEYLHAMEDTFGHRDADNVPISANWFLGHGLDGNEPDMTYKSATWKFREDRTLKMEGAVFDRIKSNFPPASANGQSKPIAFSDLVGTLEDFNSINENETTAGGAFDKKLAILNDRLQQAGFDSIPLYGVLDACKRRQENLKDAQTTLQGYANIDKLILQTPTQCPTIRGQKTE